MFNRGFIVRSADKSIVELSANKTIDVTHLLYYRFSLEFFTPSYAGAKYTLVELQVEAQTGRKVGFKKQIFNFEYRPNPILMDIQPNTTILR